MRKIIPVSLALAFFILLIWLLVDLAWSTARGSSQMPLYSAYRFDPYGSAALTQFLRATGRRVTLLTHPILPHGAAGVLINVTAPYTSGMLEDYSTHKHYNPHLLHWIASGNTLIDFTQNATGLTAYFKLRVLGLAEPAHSARPKHHKSHQKKHAQPSPLHHRFLLPANVPAWVTIMQNGRSPHLLAPWIKNVPWHYSHAASSLLPAQRRRLQLLAPADFIIPKKDSHWQILAKTKSGPVAIERHLGRGRVIFVGSPWLMLNGGIAHAGNLDFLQALLPDKPVILDQWSLGVGHNYTTLDILRRYGLIPALLELILLLMAYAWSCRGYPAAPAADSKGSVRSSVEHIAMLGHLYQSSLSEPELFQWVHHEITHRIAAALRCRPEQMPTHLQKQPVSVRQGLQSILAGLQMVERGLAEPSAKSNARKAARRRTLADLMTQSWHLVKEIHHGRHPGSKPATDNPVAAGRKS